MVPEKVTAIEGHTITCLEWSVEASHRPGEWSPQMHIFWLDEKLPHLREGRHGFPVCHGDRRGSARRWDRVLSGHPGRCCSGGGCPSSAESTLPQLGLELL